MAPAASTRSRSTRSAVTTVTSRPSATSTCAMTSSTIRHPRPGGVDGAQPPVPPGRIPLPRLALQDHDDLVMRQRGVRQPFLQ